MYTTKKNDPNTRVKAGVGVVITDNNGRILLERRSDNGMWGLPGGGIDAGESITEAAIREVKEETGLDVRITGLIGVYSDPSEGRIVTYPDNGDVVHLVDTVLKAEIMTGELVLSGESLELQFFSPNSLPTVIVPPAVKPLMHYLEGEKSKIN